MEYLVKFPENITFYRLMNKPTVATRKIGINAKGNKKRLGNAKKCSSIEDLTEGTEKGTKDSRKRSHIESSNVEQNCSKGIRKSIQESSPFILIHHEDLSLMKKDFQSFHRDVFGNSNLLIETHFKSNYSKYLWPLLSTTNYLFFGIGSKRIVLDKFASVLLDGEDVLEIDGKVSARGQETRMIRELLNTICSSILRNKEIGNSIDDVVIYTERVIDCLMIHYGRDAHSKETFLRADPSIPTVDKTRKSNFSNMGKYDEDETIATTSVIQTDPPVSVTGGEEDSAEKIAIPLVIESAEHKSKEGDNSETAGRTLHWEGRRDYRMRSSDAHSHVLNISSYYGNPLKVRSYINPQWGGRYSHAQTKLYIVVHNIEGESLCNHESQLCLSMLAGSEAVGIIASYDHLNTPIMWDIGMSNRYNWQQVHFPTYISQELPMTSPFITSDRSNSTLSARPSSKNKGLEYLLRSLTVRHHELLRILSTEAFDRAITAANERSQKGSKSRDKQKAAIQFDKTNVTLSSEQTVISVEDVLEVCRKSLAVSTRQDLNSLLKEFIDHGVLSLTKDGNRNDLLKILLPQKDLIQFCTL